MTNKVRITPGLAVELDKIIEESIKSALTQRALQEKEKQVSSTGDSQPTTPQMPTNATKDSNDPGKLSSGDVSASDVIEKLNSIRSGKSFKDESISNAMDRYINDLSKAERVALLAFLKGISQIVTGEVSGEDAVEPSDPPATVDMKKTSSTQTKSIKPNIIKMSADKAEKKDEIEDTSAPVPITPKKK